MWLRRGGRAGWVVFAPVMGEVDLSKFTSIPLTLPSDGKPLAAQFGTPQNTHLDLAPLGGGQRERKQAICFRAGGSYPADMDVEFGAAADYWMEWWLNGKLILSTMSAGNGQVYDISDPRREGAFQQGAEPLRGSCPQRKRWMGTRLGRTRVVGPAARQTLSGTPNAMLRGTQGCQRCDHGP